MTKTAEEVEREVEASRQDLDRTVEALKEKMTPGQLFDEASRAMGGAGNQILSKFVEQAKENPMPLAVMGLGLVWLMTSQNKARQPSYGAYKAGYAGESYSADGYGGPYGSHSGVGGKVSETAHAVADKASGALSSTKESLASAKHGLANAAAGAAQSTRSAAGKLSYKASEAAEKVEEYRHQAQRKVAETFEQDPLVIGAVGLAVGVAVGAAIPATAAENRYFGPARDRILDKGKDLAQGGLEQAKGVAQAAYGGVKSELERTADGDGDLAERAGQVARAGAQAVQQELHSPRPN